MKHIKFDFKVGQSYSVLTPIMMYRHGNLVIKRLVKKSKILSLGTQAGYGLHLWQVPGGRAEARLPTVIIVGIWELGQGAARTFHR